MISTGAEHLLIDRLAGAFRRSPLQRNRTHESDAEIITLPGSDAHILAATTDSICEEIRTGLYRDPYIAGWMVVMANLSDLAATGAVPLGLLVSEIIPPAFGDDSIARLQRGIRDACDASGTFVLGGDTNAGEDLILTGTAIGTITSRGANSRMGCRPGDLLYVSGPLGTGNAFALEMLAGESRNGSAASPLESGEPWYLPVARLKEGMAICGLASACMDTSDGAIATMDELMRLNSVGIRINDDWMRCLDTRSRDLVIAKGIAPWLLLAGEHGEFELMFTIPADRQPDLTIMSRNLGWNPMQIGRIIELRELLVPLYGRTVSLDHTGIRNAATGVNGDTRIYIETLIEYDKEIREEKNEMKSADTYNGGENFDLRTMLVRGHRMRLHDKTRTFGALLGDVKQRNQLLTMRSIDSPSDTEVDVIDPATGSPRRMLMFGSNNYLGFANDSYVRERARQALNRFGVGIGGPPMLNGTTTLHRDLELRLAALKGAEDAVIFPSGYGANVGIITALANPHDLVLYDAYSHASFCDGVTMSGVESMRFPHNDASRLSHLLDVHSSGSSRDIFVGVEGVYSMDGDLAPLDIIVPLCHEKEAIVVLDDAHGTGTTGKTGRGTAEHFGVEGSIDITMGTFSKTFAVSGGFVAASRPIVDYLRYFARPYMFSASLPPVVIAAVHAGLDLLEREPERLTALHRNVDFAVAGLRNLGIDVSTQSAIIPLRIPITMDMRRAAVRMHELGIFVNAVEFPAVPVSQQRFRISLMAIHTTGQIQRLLDAIETVWNEWRAGQLMKSSSHESSEER